MVGAPSACSLCDCNQEDEQVPHVEHTLTRTLAVANAKFQAQVYDIPPPTTAIVDYAIGLEKLSASEQVFDDRELKLYQTFVL